MDLWHALVPGGKVGKASGTGKMAGPNVLPQPDTLSIPPFPEKLMQPKIEFIVFLNGKLKPNK